MIDPRLVWRAAVCAALLAAAGPAFAADDDDDDDDRAGCAQTALRVEGGRVAFDYDPFLNEDLDAPVPLFAPDGVCPRGVRVAVAPLGALTPFGRGLSLDGWRFEVQDADRRSAISAAGGTGGASLGALRGGRRAPGPIGAPLTISARRGQPTAPGTYLAEALLRTYQDGVLVGEERFDIEARIRPSFRLAASTAVLDFGELETGAERTVTLSAFANATYTLSLTSDFGWRLISDATRDAPDIGVPYTVLVEGAPVTPQGALGAVRRRAPGQGLDVLQLRVRIGDIAGLPAGQYRDFLTISLAPAV